MSLFAKVDATLANERWGVDAAAQFAATNGHEDKIEKDLEFHEAPPCATIPGNTGRFTMDDVGRIDGHFQGS